MATEPGLPSLRFLLKLASRIACQWSLEGYFISVHVLCKMHPWQEIVRGVLLKFRYKARGSKSRSSARTTSTSVLLSLKCDMNNKQIKTQCSGSGRLLIEPSISPASRIASICLEVCFIAVKLIFFF